MDQSLQPNAPVTNTGGRWQEVTSLNHATPPDVKPNGVDLMSGMALATNDCRYKDWKTRAASAVPLALSWQRLFEAAIQMSIEQKDSAGTAFYEGIFGTMRDRHAAMGEPAASKLFADCLK
jgi:hypothetical protein